MNNVEETIRAIDSSINYYKKQIRELTEVKKEILDKFDIPYEKEGE